MSTAVAVIAIGAFLAVLVALVVALRARRELQVFAEQERTSRFEAQRTAEHLETRVRTLRSELAEQHHANAELGARLRRTSTTDTRSVGLWALERQRQARVAGTPLLGAGFGPGMDLVEELRAAITLELELLREEVGTHAELTELVVSEPLGAREALATLRIVQELAAALAKRADELRITVRRDGESTVIGVEATGIADAPPSRPAFEQGLAAMGAELQLQDGTGTLAAVVRLPI